MSGYGRRRSNHSNSTRTSCACARRDHRRGHLLHRRRACLYHRRRGHPLYTKQNVCIRCTEAKSNTNLDVLPITESRTAQYPMILIVTLASPSYPHRDLHTTQRSGIICTQDKRIANLNVLSLRRARDVRPRRDPHCGARETHAASTTAIIDSSSTLIVSHLF